ncbi:MAG: alpha/beta hydrolase-fold protein [Myxococcota bacterium]
MTRTLTRRQCLGTAGLAGVALGCNETPAANSMATGARSAPPRVSGRPLPRATTPVAASAPRAPETTPSSGALPRRQDAPPWAEVPFPATAFFPEEHALILRRGVGDVLVALHGRGEVDKGLQGGARGWRDDYRLDRALERVTAPPLVSADLLGFVTSRRLAALNASLAAHPYRGIAVACPWAPALEDRSPRATEPFARFLIEDLVPRARREAAGMNPLSRRTGIDGVSMGGRLALLIGLRHPDVFDTIGALQPAIRPGEVDEIVGLARDAQRRREGALALRLVTSTGDYFRGAVRALSAALERAAVPHELVETPGPHNYAYNRGPGAYELLLWHERLLRGLPPP